MPLVRVANNVSSVSTVLQGVITPTNNQITVNDAGEATTMCSPYSNYCSGGGVDSTTGNQIVNMVMPSCITGITINGNSYTPVNGLITGVPEADAATYVADFCNLSDHTFQLISG